MQIINSEIAIPKTEVPSSEYFETELKRAGIDYIRWAIVRFDADNYMLNVSHKVQN